MNVLRRVTWPLPITLSLLIAACGGGGTETDGGGSSMAVPGAPAPAASFACDMAAAASAAPKAPSIVSPLIFPAQATVAPPTVERWPVTISGQAHELNVLVSRPAASISIRGIVLKMHGHSPTLATLPPMAMLDQYWDGFVTGKGYVSVSVARRGNYGSTGERLVDVAATGLLAQYQAGQIPYADLSLAAWRYQSDSMVAALSRMAADPSFAPYMHTLILIGASGGAATVLQTAADSSVYKAAQKKALIRISGRDSVFDTNPDAAPGEYQYLSRIAASTSPSLWLGGLDDPVTSAGNLSCEFRFFNEASGFVNQMYLIPGYGHGGFQELLSDALYPIVLRPYLVAQGLDGF